MDELNNILTQLASPHVTVFIGLVISLIVKDVAGSLAKGLAFKLNPMFNEGDTVLIDDELAIIVKIGINNTIFGITKSDGSYAWRFVPNQRIAYLKIEKVVRDLTVTNQDD